MEAQDREAGVRQQLADLGQQLSTLQDEEQRLTADSQRLQAKVDAFRVRKETIKASYTAAEASLAISAAFADIGGHANGQEPSDVEAAKPPASGGAPPAAGETPEGSPDLAQASGDESGPADRGGVATQPGLMELRPGAPDSMQAGLLFVMEPRDTVVLVAWVEEPGGSPEKYRKLMPDVTARLAMSQSAPPATAAPPAPAGGFLSYDAESFLDEFFPGAEKTEVDIEAAARAEPGAAEVRTLAAYVRALGGTLEIIADIGGERIVLR